MHVLETFLISLPDIVGNAMKELWMDDDDVEKFGLTPEFWVQQRNFAVRSLLQYAASVRHAGLGVVRRGRVRLVPKMKRMRRNEDAGPTNFITWSSKRRNDDCPFYTIISRDVGLVN